MYGTGKRDHPSSELYAAARDLVFEHRIPEHKHSFYRILAAGTVIPLPREGMHAPSHGCRDTSTRPPEPPLAALETTLGGRTFTGMCSRWTLDVRQPGVIRCRSWLSGTWGSRPPVNGPVVLQVALDRCPVKWHGLPRRLPRAPPLSGCGERRLWEASVPIASRGASRAA